MTERLSRRSVLGFVGAALSSLPITQALAEDDPWLGLHQDVFGNRPIAEEDGLVTLEAPVRAEDAALVPLTVRVSGGDASRPRSLTLLIDRNPAPVVATFSFGEGAGEVVLATRVRVDAYSNVRAVVETQAGSLHMATRYVKASGGCSAPALKDSELAEAELGKMRLRQFAAAPGSTSREAQLMIRHPNHSGLQMNQLTGYYIPAKFITDLEVRRGAALVFRMEGGISLSADPNIRFTFRPAGADEVLTAVAKDTDGRVLRGSWPVKSGDDS
ncbi:quinoprotein dehydrogenase-associated SoxYZ-like carrier [Bosea sp. Root381]|uniref:quinoprotein dehydrogenase-associated SoxYZ-like carrier n=1 Tax=Bosea sp. Root381 TaxID=1736524 RepID=UPI0006F1F641|nr:quinoprotein dehydrogenase-associated SoxYZ-like carrier [Bosea sp. Root381]KRE15932.1 quinoprotein dehydrogenase-associated SoxYZ-like carrier [Bosea sp. Root381]